VNLTDSGDCEAQGPASIIPEQDDYESEEYFSDDHNGASKYYLFQLPG
jgi:hypothetical protein